MVINVFFIQLTISRFFENSGKKTIFSKSPQKMNLLKLFYSMEFRICKKEPG